MNLIIKINPSELSEKKNFPNLFKNCRKLKKKKKEK